MRVQLVDPEGGQVLEGHRDDGHPKGELEGVTLQGGHPAVSSEEI